MMIKTLYNKTFLVSGFAVIFSLNGTALAQTQNSSELAEVFACRSLPNDAERLACYDATIEQFAKAQEDGEVFTVSKEQIQNVERDSFGFNIPSLPILSGLFGGNADKAPKSNPLTDAVEVAKTTKGIAAPKSMKDVLPETAEVKQINLEIVKLQTFGYKKTRLFMSNGQVWEQLDAIDLKIPKIRESNRPVAEIRKGALGSFNMQINGSGRAVKVKRVR